MEEFEFDFERLEVYQKSISFSKQVFNTTTKFTREYQSSLGDQLRRAGLSICNNIAEGSRKSGRSRTQFYQYALDSARECIPMITIAIDQNQLSVDIGSNLRQNCISITKMLFRLIESTKL